MIILQHYEVLLQILQNIILQYCLWNVCEHGCLYRYVFPLQSCFFMWQCLWMPADQRKEGFPSASHCSNWSGGRSSQCSVIWMTCDLPSRTWDLDSFVTICFLCNQQHTISYGTDHAFLEQMYVYEFCYSYTDRYTLDKTYITMLRMVTLLHYKTAEVA